MDIWCSDILKLICEDLSIQDINSLSRVSKKQYTLIKQTPEVFWYKHCDIAKNFVKNARELYEKNGNVEEIMDLMSEYEINLGNYYSEHRMMCDY